MENVSKINTNFDLLGIVEMENYKYLYSVIALALYLINIFICSMIVYVSWTEESLHEPMYIFICNLVINGIFGSSAFFPKLAIDLLSGCSTISLSGCLTQAFCIQSFASVEIYTFSIMAYDRLLAVGHPLRYHSLMTNGKALKIIIVIWIYVFIGVFVSVVLTTRVTFCGIGINNVFCETMSLLHLACGNSTVPSIFGTVSSLSMVISCILVAVYCYIGTFVICLTLSLEASQKAIHTLVMHIVTFSTCMAACLFVTFRYRLNIGTLSIAAHVVISVGGLTLSLTINPLVYGIRTEALRIKMIQSLIKCFREHK